MNESDFTELVANADEQLRKNTDTDAPRSERVEEIVKYVEQKYPDATEGIDTNPVQIASELRRRSTHVAKSNGGQRFTDRFVADATGRDTAVYKQARKDESEAIRKQYTEDFGMSEEKFDSLSKDLGDVVANADG